MGDNQYLNTTGEDSVDGLNFKTAYEERIRNKITKDFNDAETFLRSYHDYCRDAYEMYNNARTYESLRKNHRFPSPLVQQHIDDFVANLMDKIWYNNRPCTIVGREETDKADAHAKQEMMNYQDYEDDMYSKISVFLRDTALYGTCIGQVDYDERKVRKIIGVNKPIPVLDQFTQEPIINLDGTPAYEQDINGEPVTESVLETVDDVVYRGAKTKRIDPLNFFFTSDKTPENDDKPIMIRTYVSLDDLEAKSYFFNLDLVRGELPLSDLRDDDSGANKIDQNAKIKRSARGFNPDIANSKNKFEYIEWQGRLERTELYEYLGKTPEEIEYLLGDGNKKSHCIVGLINRRIIVRLEETPFDIDCPNIVMGMIQRDEDEPVGLSIVDKLYSAHKGTEDMLGMLFENLKQSVNSMWIINVNSLARTGGQTIVNKAGQALEVTSRPDEAARRVEQPGIAKDFYQILSILNSYGKTSTGNEDILSGKGDPQAETLGEVQIVANQASVKIINYLRTFEDFIVNLYSMRNQINVQFIDQSYAYRVIGESANEWRTIDPRAIRANVDFICEASSRETNKAVITQQILQLIQICIPLYQSGMGLPIRFDKLIKRLCEQGFTWSPDNIEEYFPSLKLEKMGFDIDSMMIQNMLVGLQARQLQSTLGMMGPLMGAGAGGNQPKPRNENEAIESANARNQTQVGRE